MEKKITMSTLADFPAKDNEIKVELASGCEVTVRKHLTMEEKVKLIEEIVIACSYGAEPYLNPLKLKVLATLKVLDLSTDINVLDDAEADVYALYNVLDNAGILTEVLPYTDYQEIVNWSYESSEALLKYRNSFIGIMDEIKDKLNAEDLSETVQQLIDEIKTNPEIQEIYDIYKEEVAN